MNLLYVHGRSQQGKDPEKLQDEWTEALKRGLQEKNLDLPPDTVISLPFYGDRLDYFAKQSEVPLSEDIMARGDGVDMDYLDYFAEMMDALRIRAGVTDQEIDTEYGDNPRPKGPQNWEWVLAIARTLDKIPFIRNLMLDSILRDVYLYIKHAGVRDEINKIVLKALSPGEPTVIIGHSLGSVVIYHILRMEQRDYNIPLLLTVGSPLAVRYIRYEFRPIKFPEHVVSWCNVYDDKDIVALHPLDLGNFPVRPPIENMVVVNEEEGKHGIEGYLSIPDVAKIIYDKLIQ